MTEGRYTAAKPPGASTRLFALFLLTLAPPAGAVPLQLTHTGRLADATGAPVTGPTPSTSTSTPPRAGSIRCGRSRGSAPTSRRTSSRSPSATTVRRYECFCGDGNHTSGGTLREVSATQVTGPLVSLSLGNVRDTGLDHSGIRMYDSKLTVTQPAYAESYAKVTVYGSWPSYRAGTAFSSTGPSAVWATWTK